MEKITEVRLEEADGSRGVLAVNWLVIGRPTRFRYQGRLYEASGVDKTGSWLYRTLDRPVPEDRYPVVLTEGPGACVVERRTVTDPSVGVVVKDGQVYVRWGETAEGVQFHRG